MDGAAIVQIIPPFAGGVRDYAECLRAEWSRRGVNAGLLAFDRVAARRLSLAERLTALSRPSGAPAVVLLHFSGYGYESRALCFWLLRELHASARELGRGFRLLTMMHELFASGPPWRSAFWLGGLQARIAAEVARASNAVVTSSERHAKWMRAHVNPGVDVRVAPMFSTIGEPDEVRPISLRGSDMVVFGSASTRQRAFHRLGAHIAQLKALGIRSIVEAGPGPLSRLPETGLARSHAGVCSPQEIEALLQRHRYALIDYPSFHLAKSSVFAAYAANGCVVLNTAADTVDADGLRSGEHYLSLGLGSARQSAAPQEMTAMLRSWYLGHRRGRQATEFLDDLAAVAR